MATALSESGHVARPPPRPATRPSRGPLFAEHIAFAGGGTQSNDAERQLPPSSGSCSCARRRIVAIQTTQHTHLVPSVHLPSNNYGDPPKGLVERDARRRSAPAAAFFRVRATVRTSRAKVHLESVLTGLRIISPLLGCAYGKVPVPGANGNPACLAFGIEQDSRIPLAGATVSKAGHRATTTALW